MQSQQVFANMTKSTPELFVQSQFDLSALCSLECKDICRCSVIIQYNFYKSIWSILTIVQVLFLQQSPTPCKIKALSLTISTLQKKVEFHQMKNIIPRVSLISIQRGDWPDSPENLFDHVRLPCQLYPLVFRHHPPAWVGTFCIFIFFFQKLS